MQKGGFSKRKKLLEIQEVAKKLPSNLWKALVIPCSTNMVSIRVNFQGDLNFILFYWSLYFGVVSNNTIIIILTSVGFEMIIATQGLRVSLAIYHFICNASSGNDC